MHILRRIAVALLLLGCASARADVGMITQLSGEVMMASAGTTRAAVPFYKVSAGEKLTLGAQARLQIVYFSNGRQEVWQGAGSVEIGSLESKSTLQPKVTQLPPLVVNQLAKTPAAGQHGKTGTVRVRSLAKPDASHIEKQYRELRAGAAPDDTTPEVFLLSGLLEIRNYARAKELLAEYDSKPGLKSVVDHFSPLVAAGAPK